MLRVHIVSDHSLPPSLLAIGRPLPGALPMPGTGTITPQPSDTPGLMPDIEIPRPRPDTPGLPGNVPLPSPDAPDPGAPVAPDAPGIFDVPEPNSPLPDGNEPGGPRQDPDYPAVVPIPM